MGKKRQRRGPVGRRRRRPEARAPQAAVAVPPEWLLALLYGLTGAAVLIHEVAWTRTARTLLGGDARAVTVALVAVLGGMGFGGLLAPRVARRWGALGGFARVEAAAAIYAAALPWVAPLLDGAVGAAFHGLGTGAGFTFATVLLATLLFTPPALAMGAGLPLLAQARAAAGRTPRDAGVLYATHALGGAAGGIAAAFALMPEVGVPAAVGIASLVQIGVAVAAAWLRPAAAAPLDTREPKLAERDDRLRSTSAAGRRVIVWLLLAALLAGVGTAALQTLAARLATLAVGPSVQGFALVAGAYVLALAVGAGLVSPFVRHTSTPSAVYAALALGACAAAIAGVSAMGGWPARAAEIFAAVEPGAGPPWAPLAWMVALPLFAPVALSAAAFPFGVGALARTGKRSAARDVGWLVAAGAAGNVIGVPVATFALVPALGPSRALVAAAAALGAAGLLAAIAGFRGGPARPPLRARHALVVLALCGICGAVLAGTPRRFDPDALTRGPFLYAGGESAPALGEVTFVHHGVEATVTVRDRGPERLLQIDGKVDASAHGDAPTQILAGVIPGLLADTPGQALVIGLGTGTTADAVRSVPGVQRVEVAELVDGVRWAAPMFRAFNGDVLADPRVEVRPVDGALLLRHGEREYDLIVSEPSNPWVAGMGDLFSEEAFADARARLAPGGVFATWFHVYSTDMEIVRSIVATFLRVFPDATLWELARGQDYVLIGKRPGDVEPVHLDLDRIAARAAAPEVEARLRRAGIASAEGLLGRFVAAGDGLEHLARDADVLSSRDGSLEARAARSLYHDASGEALSLFASLPRRPGGLRVRATTEDGRELAAAATRAIEAGALGRTMVLEAVGGDEEAAIAAGERAVGLLPDDPSLRDGLATLYLARGKTHALVREDARARDALLTVLELEPGPATRADALTTLGDLHRRAEEHGHALQRYQAARRLQPRVPMLTERIADCLEALGNTEDAHRERRLATRLRRAQM